MRVGQGDCRKHGPNIPYGHGKAEEVTVQSHDDGCKHKRRRLKSVGLSAANHVLTLEGLEAAALSPLIDARYSTSML